MSTWHELATETHLVVHIEQVTGGAAVDCYCGAPAVMLVTSEPDMEPGFVCGKHGFEWIDSALSLLRAFFLPA